MGFWVGEKHVYLDFEGYYREEGSIYGFRWSMLVYFGGGIFFKNYYRLYQEEQQMSKINGILARPRFNIII